MSSYTGASALLAMLTLPEADCNGPIRCLVNARRSLRNAIRRLVRAHGGRLGPAAAQLGVSKEALIAGAAAVGLSLVGKPGRPRARHSATAQPRRR